MSGPPFKDSIFICHKCGSRALHVLSACKRLNFLRFLAQPGILHVPKSALVREMLQAVVLDTEIVSS